MSLILVRLQLLLCLHLRPSTATWKTQVSKKLVLKTPERSAKPSKYSGYINPRWWIEDHPNINMGNYSSFYKGTYGNAVPKQTPKYFDNACSSSSRINLMLNDFENIYIGLYMYKCIYIFGNRVENYSRSIPSCTLTRTPPEVSHSLWIWLILSQ